MSDLFKLNGYVHADSVQDAYEFQIELRGDKWQWLVYIRYGLSSFRNGTDDTLEGAWRGILAGVQELHAGKEIVTA